MPVGGMRELRKYIVWMQMNPNHSRAEAETFLQSLIDDPENSLKRGKVMTGKIITTHVWPPIPRRDWDWSAYHDGEEETGHYGWGRTEEEAIDDLKRLDEERAEALAESFRGK